MNPRRMTSFILLCASLATVSATDIFLPSLPGIVKQFSSSTESVQMTVYLYLMASFFAAPVWGMLSDHIGRKKTLYIGMILFCLSSMLCMFSNSLLMLLIGRIFQGASAVCCPIVSWTSITDLYEKDESARVIALMGSVITLGPLLSPLLGGWMDRSFGWRSNFLFVFILGLIPVLLMHVIPFQEIKLEKKQLSFFGTTKSYISVFKNFRFVSYALIFGFLCAGELFYLTMAPFYLEGNLNLSADKIGLCISFAALAYIVGSLACDSMIKFFGMDGALKTGLVSVLFSGLLLFVVHSLWKHSLPFFIISASIYLFGMSIVWGPSTSRALQQVPTHKRGMASATRSLMINALQSLGSLLGGLFNPLYLLPLACVFLMTALGALVSYVLAVRLKQS